MAPATGGTKNTTLTNCIGERVKEIANTSWIEVWRTQSPLSSSTSSTFLSRFCSTLISPVWRIRNQSTATASPRIQIPPIWTRDTRFCIMLIFFRSFTFIIAACCLDSILLLARSHRVNCRGEAETRSRADRDTRRLSFEHWQYRHQR